MFLMKKHTLTAALILVMSMGMASCSDDEETVDPIEPVVTEEPMSPPDSADLASMADPVYFAFDDYTLNMEAQDRLTALADHLKANPGAVLQIEGHCDERGSIEYNLALGERRAQSVKDFLVNLGVDSASITTISFGEEKPAVEGHDEAAWSQNRRAEFSITAQ